MRVKHWALTGLLAALLGLGACNTTPRVRYDYDAKANLANYQHFVWEQAETDATAGGPAFNNPLNEQRLRDAVQEELSKRGITPAADSKSADCYVTIAIGSRQAVDTERSRVRFGFGFGTWQPGFGSSVFISDDPGYNYREGRITIDLYDAATRKALWHASVEQDLTYLTKENAEKRINQVVAAMFAKYPGTGKSSN